MGIITLDFETYYDKDYSLSKMSTEAYIRDPKFEVIGFGYRIDDQPPVWCPGDSDLRIAALGALLGDNYLLCHNTAFDGAILKWRYGITPKFYLDTLSMARPVTGATVGGSLAKLAKKFMLGEKGDEVVKAIGKRRADFTPAELAAYGQYCVNDVLITHNLFHVLRQFSTEKEMYVIDMMLRMFIDPVLELDKEVLNEHLAKIKQAKADLMSKLHWGREELMSNPKLARLLEELGVDPPRKPSPSDPTKTTWAFSKNDHAFKELLEHPNPQVQAVVAARLGVKSTLEETRTEALLGVQSRGLLAVMLNYYGAHTGRASGADKINLQNLPRGGALRRAIRAPKEHIIVAGDSSQIEARIVAWWAGQEDLVQAFRDKRDIYSEFATDVYGRPVNRKRVEIVDGKETLPDFLPGFVGKTCILGLGFGMGPPKLRNTLKIGQGGVSVDVPLAECERIVKEVYRKKYDRIVALWKSCQEAMESVVNGYSAEIGVSLKLLWDSNGIHLPNGMLIRYENLRRQMKQDGTGTEYVYDSRKGPVRLYGGKIVENVVQALARIVVFDQMCVTSQQLRVSDTDPTRRFVLPLTVHDEIVTVVPEAWGDAMAKTLEIAMSKPPKWGLDLPIACEVKKGVSYADCK